MGWRYRTIKCQSKNAELYNDFLTMLIDDLRTDWHELFACRISSWVARSFLPHDECSCTPPVSDVCLEGQP